MKIEPKLTFSGWMLRAAAVVILFLGTHLVAEAATLSLSPSTGVYQSGTTFSVRVVVNTSGQAVNAADATLRFNPNELSVVSVNRSSSIFNLWVAEPTFSNSNGTISFSGGSPAGYTGSAGTVMNITFRALGSGAVRVNFGDGSVLANDGRGTNVLSSMNGGSYTLQAASAAPTPEVIEYVPPANTPGLPVITSTTHADSDAWYNRRTAELSWTLPAGITAVRTLLDSNPSSVPTRVYETPISSITLDDLDEGVSYFHLQFQNEDGWGRVAHYRLAVDTSAPTGATLSQPEGTDFTSPEQTLELRADDSGAPITRMMIRIDDDEPFEQKVTMIDGMATVTLPTLEPGYHSVIAEVFDEAQNGTIVTYSFTILAFDRPQFTEVPTEMSAGVIPVVRGLTRPQAAVTVTMTRVGASPQDYEVIAGTDGVFTFIPEEALREGVYDIYAVAVDAYGAVSERSDTVRIAVQEPGFLRIGTMLVSVVSVVVSLVALIALLLVGSLFTWRYLRRFRANVTKESKEALAILEREFTNLEAMILTEEAELAATRKTGKLTKAESDMVATLLAALKQSKAAVVKEMKDVTQLTD